jgi:hypothetical protein
MGCLLKYYLQESAIDFTFVGVLLVDDEDE